MDSKYNPSSLNKLLSWKRDISDGCRRIVLGALKGDDGTNAETLGAMIHNCLNWSIPNADGEITGLPLDLCNEKDQAMLVMMAAIGFEHVIEEAFNMNLPGKNDDCVRVIPDITAKCPECGLQVTKKALHNWGLTLSVTCSKCGHSYKYTPPENIEELENKLAAQALKGAEHPDKAVDVEPTEIPLVDATVDNSEIPENVLTVDNAVDKMCVYHMDDGQDNPITLRIKGDNVYSVLIKGPGTPAEGRMIPVKAAELCHFRILPGKV